MQYESSNKKDLSYKYNFILLTVTEDYKKEMQSVKLIELFHTHFIHAIVIRWEIRFKDTRKLLGICSFNTWN